MSLFNIDQIPEKYSKLGMIEYIGHGSIGTVFKISGSGKDYALKVMDCGKNDSKYIIAKKEVEVLEQLDGAQHIVGVFDTSEVEGNDGKTVFILEEYGVLMSEYVKNTDISVSGALRIVIGIADAILECEKRGVVHLDIQPNNIFFNQSGQVMLGDFNSALFLNELGNEKRKRGTLSFMAPEVYRKGECSIESDIYSLGVLMYWLLNNGEIPFLLDGKDEVAIYKRLAGTVFPQLKSINEDVRAELESIINRACAYEKSERYPSIENFVDELTRIWELINEGILHDFIIEKKQDNANQRQSLTFSSELPSDNLFGNSVSFDTFDADPIATSIALWDIDPLVAPPGKGAGGNNDVTNGGFRDHNNTVSQKPCVNCGYLLGTERFCPNCGARVVRENSGLKVNKVNFSAVAPTSVVRGEYSLIDVIMYEEQFRRIVDDKIDHSETEIKETKSSSVRVVENAKIKMIISTLDFEIQDDTEEREWIGEYLDFSFSVMVPERIEKTQILFTITVFINNIMSTRLKFTANVTDSKEKQEMNIYREDIKSAFVSFAKEDKYRALRIVQGVQLIRPDMDIFMDVDTIRLRKDYDYSVKKEIDYRDVFYLCWSGFAKRSKQVELEWRYALKKKGITGIEALPLELPDNCPPPVELQSKYFNDKLFIHMLKTSVEINYDKVQINKNLYLDKGACVVIMRGRTIKLTKLEYLVLECLVNNIGRILNNDTLARYAWGEDYFEGMGDDSNVRRIIKQLRSKLGDNIIENSPGLGYRISKEPFLSNHSNNLFGNVDWD